MAMGTTHQPQTTMHPAPTTHPPAPGPHMDPPVPGAPGVQDVSKPFLPEDFDKVLMLRCYPNAKSMDELRSMAIAAGETAMKLAEESKAAVDVPVPELGPDGQPLPPKEPPPPPKDPPPAPDKK